MQKLKEIVQNGFLPETQNVTQNYDQDNQLCPLFRQLTHLIDMIIEGLDFLETSFFQRQEDRMSMFNQRLFFKPTKNFDDMLIGKVLNSLPPSSYTSLTLQDFIIDGPQRNSKILKIVETFLTFDQHFKEQELMQRYPNYLNREMVEVILSKRYLEEAKSLLLAKSNEFVLN
jgi:hypothetical protein